MKEIKICTKCVMDSTDSKIVFDENGVCDFCRDYEKHIAPYWTPNKERIDELLVFANKIKKSRKKNCKYDCVIGFSGGVDSSYLCYIAKVVMKLNPILYICDTGWNLPVANDNMKRVIEKLGLDYYEEKVNWEEMKDFQISMLKAKVPYQDMIQDLAIFSGLYNFAVKNKIKYVLSGANIATESIRPPIEWNYFNDLKMFKDIHKKYGSIELKTFPMCSMFKYRIYYRYFKGMKRFAPLDYVKYNKKDIVKFLKEYFGYEEYLNKHYENVFTRWYEGYYLVEKFGYDKRKCYFSNLIHINEMSREEALIKLKERPYPLKEAMKDQDYIANKLGLSNEEFTQIIDINGEKKTYKDYKNSFRLISFFIKLSRLLGMENRNFR